MLPAALLTGLLALALPAAAPAQGTFKAPCIEGSKSPRCIFWDAKATFIADGDTIKVKLDDDPSRAVQLVRFTGINAMELHRYSKYAGRRRGECHGLAATALVEHYIRASHWRVRLAAQRASSESGARHRLRRSVWVKVGGQWRDLAKLEMEQGLALWLPNETEWAHNREYHVLAEEAALAKHGLYDPASCGVGPDEDLPVSVSVNWDSDGPDSRNLDGEWVEIRNAGARPLPVGGWWLRDSWLNYDRSHKPGYGFPAGASVPAFGTIRVHIGCGNNTAGDFYWCQGSSAFENVTHDKTQMGDGAYLFDPQGDLRSSQIYPCLVACADPLAGAIRVDVRPKTPESITLTNVSGGPVDLGEHVLQFAMPRAQRDSYVFGYAFGPGTVLAPGQTLTVLPGGSRLLNVGMTRQLGRGQFVLPDGGGQVSLRTATDIRTTCFSWGRGHC
jgi:endonuclease YncB( thermonuclease family)